MSSSKARAPDPTPGDTDTHTNVFEIRRFLRKERKRDSLALLSLFPLVWSSLVFLYISLVLFAFPGSRTTQLCYQGTFAAPEWSPPGEGQGRGIYHERGRCSEAAYSIQKLLLWNWAFDLLFFFQTWRSSLSKILSLAITSTRCPEEQE